MTPNTYKPLFVLIFCAITTIGFSQSKSAADVPVQSPDTTTTTKKAYLRIGIDYTSNNVFMGRTDTVKTPVISPAIKYSFKSGVFISAGLDILPKQKKSKLDGGNLELGYDFDITDNLSGGVSYTKLFYATNSTQVSSSVSSTLNGNFDYNIADIVTALLSFDYNVNKAGINDDAVLNLGLSHDFIAEGVFGDKDIVLISPSVVTNMGTQNFYDGYLVKKKFKNAKLNAAETKLFASYAADLSQFKTLDYEFSLPIEYKNGPFIFHITPSYAQAENQFQSAAIRNLLGLSSQSNVFYVELGVALKF